MTKIDIDKLLHQRIIVSTPKRRVRDMRASIYLNLGLWSALISKDPLLSI